MKLGYTIIYVADPARSLDFYEAAFGLPRRFLHESGQYGELGTGETTLAFASLELGAMNFPDGVRANSLDEKPSATEIAFVTPDVATAYLKAINAGDGAYVPPAKKPWGQVVAYLRDADGTLVELCTPMGG